MISEEFCQTLEFKICESFNNEKDIKLKTLWCDGVTKPENEYNLNRNSIRLNSKLELKAWFGQTGQEVYKLILNLGKKSKLQILNGNEIIDCIPSVNSNWIELDEENKILYLDLL